VTEGSFYFRSAGFWLKGLNGVVERFEQKNSIRLVHYSDAASYSSRPLHQHPPQQSTLEAREEAWEAFWEYLEITDAWSRTWVRPGCSAQSPAASNPGQNHRKTAEYPARPRPGSWPALGLWCV
jgi:hypothetical protein